NNFGVEYDYSSVMHYDPYGFAMNENIPVIIAKDTNAQSSMGQRERAAFSDIKMINSLYNCAQKCPSPSVKCLNGGIINSKTCYSCICPYMVHHNFIIYSFPSLSLFSSLELIVLFVILVEDSMLNLHAELILR
ncbi:hypothetical protein PRIPAC_93684, partial [Pristionchus pacificus]